MSLITVIGRGHSGTRLISHTLYASGVSMGRLINASGDKMPPDAMYDACRVMARYVKWNGGLSWDFDALHTMDIDPEFIELVEKYLFDVLPSRGRYGHRGWKLPETTLVYPWIVRMFPDAKYIHWVRDPRDCILRRHKTDDLGDFDVEYPETDDDRERRAISWLYQYELMKATPVPEHCITVRFEDAILKQDETFKLVEDFLGFPLGKVIVRPDSVGRWKTDDGVYDFEFLRPAMEEYGYL
ncbi:MAG: sulfotransferase [Candidatus Latescibacteria bacterium]|nr:sulfotransferase [Candidatus Latescibacterota bacterium]